MSNSLLISVAACDVRVALVEDGRLAEFYLESRTRNGPTGNIYQGRVLRLLPGMAAAFVNIGLERPAYLFAEDVSAREDEFYSLWLKDEPGEAQPSQTAAGRHRRPSPRRPGGPGPGAPGAPGDQRSPSHHPHHPGGPFSGVHSYPDPTGHLPADHRRNRAPAPADPAGGSEVRGRRLHRPHRQPRPEPGKTPAGTGLFDLPLAEDSPQERRGFGSGPAPSRTGHRPPGGARALFPGDRPGPGG